MTENVMFKIYYLIYTNFKYSNFTEKKRKENTISFLSIHEAIW